ncbi:hypothetical protein BSZ39_12940 [Bowdeniella nasicola]|uniref:Uncharacterized protein n=1 Tax=Bowdeniella nasicola TaxID=208480 RepID=A0A1Q5PT91_9ACTO|nr:hypothetical protein [Bowdeniella nasicola]OKL50821.1 hypothetical protein BSZ39_12940 [Bowdeniella nasicola]
MSTFDADELTSVVRKVLTERWHVYMEGRAPKLHSIGAEVGVAFADAEDLRARGARDRNRPSDIKVDFIRTGQEVRRGGVIEIRGTEDVTLDREEMSSVVYLARFGKRDGSWVLLSLHGEHRFDHPTTATYLNPPG